MRCLLMFIFVQRGGEREQEMVGWRGIPTSDFP